jgi:hypothetical protein
MEQAEIDRLRRALRQRPKPPWRVLWHARPLQLRTSARGMPLGSQRLTQLQTGWELLWTHRLRHYLAPIHRLVACRRGRHRDAHLLADDFVGSALADDHPAAAICEVCGRVLCWPNGRLAGRHSQQ